MAQFVAALLASPYVAWTVGVAGLLAFLQGALERRRMRRQGEQIAEAQEKLADDLWEVKAASEARVRAESSAHAKSRFLAAVSHEVRTPLNGVLGMAELLSSTPLDPEQQAYVDAIHSSGRALTALIDEVLDLTRIEAGRLDLVAEPFAVRTLVENVTELLAPRAQEKGLDIATLVAPEVPATLVGDAARLRQVLINLTANAIKFTERGGVGLRVALAEGGLAFTVTDTGPGVPEERRAAIFDEFEQGSAVTSRNHGGSGLGLSIARRIVTLMGGSLTLGDRPGGGSVFGFTAVLPEAAGAEPPAAAPALPDLRVRTALVVAQAPFQAAYLAQMLGAAGCKAQVATSVEAGLAAMAAAAPDLMVADCGLGEDGCARLADAARAVGVAQALLMFTPFERRAFGQRMVSAFDGWLVKPVRAQSLAGRLSPPGAPAPAPAVALARPAARPGSLRVLLAEDNEINTMVMLKMLDRIGAEVTHAADGAVALTAALAAMGGQTRPFDTILMDICMPGLDGQEAARLIRRAEQAGGAPATRIVALTAYAFEDDRQACFEAGIDDFLTKPVDFGRLRVALGLDEPRADEPERALPLLEPVRLAG